MSFWDHVGNAIGNSQAVTSPTGQQVVGGIVGAPSSTDSGDLGALKAQYGVGSGTTYQSADDPPVYLGTTPWKGAGWSGPHPTEQIVPLSKAQGDIYTWTTEQIKKFQDEIIAAGMVTKNQITYGGRDATTVAAWKQLVGQSADAYGAGVKMSPFSLLGELKANATPAAGDPLVVKLSNPEDLKANIRAVFSKSVGQAPSEDLLNKLASVYQGQERAYQTQAHSISDTGGTLTAPPDIGTFADTQAKQIDPVGYDAYKVLDKFSVLERELTGR